MTYLKSVGTLILLMVLATVLPVFALDSGLLSAEWTQILSTHNLDGLFLLTLTTLWVSWLWLRGKLSAGDWALMFGVAAVSVFAVFLLAFSAPPLAAAITDLWPLFGGVMIGYADARRRKAAPEAAPEAAAEIAAPEAAADVTETAAAAEEAADSSDADASDNAGETGTDDDSKTV